MDDNGKQGHGVGPLPQQVDDDPGGKDDLDPLLTAVGQGDHVVGHILFSEEQLVVFHRVLLGHQPCHANQQKNRPGGQLRSQYKGQDGVFLKTEQTRPKTEKDNGRRDHGEQGVDPLEPPQGLPHFPLLRQVHGDGVVQGHEEMHP